MRVSELIEKLNAMPQDAFVVMGTAAGEYVDIGDICNKMNIIKTDELRRYELGIIKDEELGSTPVVSIEPGNGLSVIDYDAEQFSYSSVDDLLVSLFGDTEIRHEACEPEPRKPQWMGTNPDSELLMQPDGIIVTYNPDFPIKWGAKTKIKTRDIKAVDEFVWYADSIIDNDNTLDGYFSPQEIAHEKSVIKIKNRVEAVEYLNDGFIFVPGKIVDIYGEIRDMTAGDYTKSLKVFIDRFIDMGYGREAYEEGKQQERRMYELSKDPEFIAQFNAAKSSIQTPPELLREIEGLFAPKTGPFYYFREKICTSDVYMRIVNPDTLERAQQDIEAQAGEHRDLWDNYMLKNYPELTYEYDADDHKSMPRGRVDCKKVDGKLVFWVTLDKCIKDKEDEIIHRFKLTDYDVEFHYGTMNYKCVHCGKEVDKKVPAQCNEPRYTVPYTQTGDIEIF